ncbi:hypothetical protein ACH40E_43830 [Streptomyces acidicola]|uniref:hypothetical protein n=1 Tax=Streptomyces acidicola TaxID=2596892 RepID=UPI00103F080D|nr:hypothetical protein [Streptomyces sp. KM273126]
MTPDEQHTPPVAFLDSQEITTTECRRCGTEVSGVNGRYACGICGWANHWSEGHNELPTADQDVDADRAAGPATGKAAGRKK